MIGKYDSSIVVVAEALVTAVEVARHGRAGSGSPTTCSGQPGPGAAREARLGPEPCHVQPSWKAPPPAGTSTGTHSGSTPRRRRGLPQFAVGVGRARGIARSSPSDAHRCEPRTYSTVPAGGGRVVEGDPAADPVGRDGPLLVARVLVEPEGLAPRAASTGRCPGSGEPRAIHRDGRRRGRCRRAARWRRWCGRTSRRCRSDGSGPARSRPGRQFHSSGCRPVSKRPANSSS